MARSDDGGLFHTVGPWKGSCAEPHSWQADTSSCPSCINTFIYLLIKLKRQCRWFVAIDAKKCYVTGRGIQQNGIRVGDSPEFVVHTDNAGDGDLNVLIEGPGGVEEPVRVNKVAYSDTVHFVENLRAAAAAR